MKSPVQLRQVILTLFIGASFIAGVRPVAAAPATQPATPAIDRFEKTIQAFEKKDQQALPAAGGTLFVGSSTFALWKTLEADFKEFHAINRGFGGSTVREVLYYTDRVVLPYKPATIVFYCGENDIASGTSPQTVLSGFHAFVTKARQALPGVRFFYISMKASPSRVKWAKQTEQGNDLIRQFAQSTTDVQFIDTAPLLRDAQGQHRLELYLPDKLHMSRAGQELWIPVIKKALQAGAPPAAATH